MKKSLKLLAALGFILVAAYSCDSNESPYEAHYQQEVRSSAVDSAADTEEIALEPEWESIRHYGYQQKEEALNEYGEAMDDLEVKIESLENKVKSANPEISHNIKERWKEDLETLRGRRDELAQKFQDLENATPESWEETFTSFEEGWNNLQNRWEGHRAE